MSHNLVIVVTHLYFWLKTCFCTPIGHQLLIFYLVDTAN
jgi:hypothetical protein